MSLRHSHSISCSAKELQEVRKYVRQLEQDLHRLRARHERQSQARALRLARAIRAVAVSPVASFAECARILLGRRSDKAVNVPALKHRKFACLERRAQGTVAAMDGAVYRTVMADISSTCIGPVVVTLRGVGPRQPTSLPVSAWLEVTPHDFELVVNRTDMPWLLLEPAQVSPSSPWAGIFEMNDMAINLALANLIELVRERRGRVIFARWSSSLPPPVFADFAAEAEHFDATLDAFKKGKAA